MSEGNCGAQGPKKSSILCLYTILDQNSCVCILSYRLAVVAILTGDIRCKVLFYKGMRISAKIINHIQCDMFFKKKIKIILNKL